jgi:hypothetical protein
MATWVDVTNDSYWSADNGMTWTGTYWASGTGNGTTTLTRQNAGYLTDTEFSLRITATWVDEGTPDTVSVDADHTWDSGIPTQDLIPYSNTYTFTVDPEASGYGVAVFSSIQIGAGFGSYYATTATITKIEVDTEGLVAITYNFFGDALWSVREETDNSTYLTTYFDLADSVSHTHAKFKIYHNAYVNPDITEVSAACYDAEGDPIACAVVDTSDVDGDCLLVSYSGGSRSVARSIKLYVNAGTQDPLSAAIPYEFYVTGIYTDVSFSGVNRDVVWTSKTKTEELYTGSTFGAADALRARYFST